MTLSGLLQNIEVLKSHGSLDQVIKGKIGRASCRERV